MPITLSVTGQSDLSTYRLTRNAARDWLAKAAVWFEGVGDAVLDARVVRDSTEKPVLLVVLHPTVPPVRVRLGGSGRVRVSATTTPAGPGYHAYLCELLDHFATDFDLTWNRETSSDPTGYFASRDRFACEQAFIHWAIGQLELAPECIGLPPGHGFTHPGPILTPLGPRTPEWTSEAVTNRGMAESLFAWWVPKLDAAFYHNRALTRLWCDFPWRPPLTEAEGELTDQIANDLATAYKLDPAGELPWREWLEVLAAIEGDDAGHTVNPNDPALVEAVTQRSWEVSPATPIGYRRFPVRVALCGGWSIEVPGDFAQEWETDRTWTGWNRTRSVWFHAMGYTKANGALPTAAEAVAVGRTNLPPGEAVPPLDAGEVCGEAVQGEADDDGRTVWRLSGVAAVPGQLVVCNVYAEDPADRDWALQVWQSLEHTS